MKKVVIGIIPTSKKDDNPYFNQYCFVKRYSHVLFKYDCVPIGILLDEDKIDYRTLDLCDGFIYPGGTVINHNLYSLFTYAIDNHKPVLGICLGMQAMGIYSLLLEEIKNMGKDIRKVREEEIKEIYDNLKNEKPFLPLVKDENKHFQRIESFLVAKEYTHLVKINPNTMLYDIYKQEEIKVTSLHHHALERVGKDFVVSARSSDGVIEAIENKDYKFIGVQYHPEAINDQKLFSYFLKLCSKE